ncbi:peroxidase family protein [Microbulbifer agarilyticus]|uniref:peroxidase family protein n=1 Tax=Microbulbifer agarilyticus TaxID=260552 RepID=UPI001CD3FB23|nr:peroxidase family protein [Microbulbifer agarilyticus]MCA0892043.1 peroxidase family protein [Microbulbifer agarilyticus]
MNKSLVVAGIAAVVSAYAYSVSGNTGESCDASAVQSYDGTCNNLAETEWGAADRLYTHGSEGSEYAEDGTSPWIEEKGLSAEAINEREISNHLMANKTGVSLNSDSLLSHNVLWMGQFVTHDASKIDRDRLSHPYYTDTVPRLIFGTDPQNPRSADIYQWLGVHPSDPSKCLPQFDEFFQFVPCASKIPTRDISIEMAQDYIDSNGVPGIPVLYPDAPENEIARIMFSRNPLLPFTGSVSSPVIVHPDAIYEVHDGRKEIRNRINSWLDLSQIYGDSAAVNADLRSKANPQDPFGPRIPVGGGKLATYDYVGADAKTVLYRPNPELKADLYEFLPTAEKIPAHPRPNDPTRAFNPQDEFLSGDDRASENLQLLTFHLAFHRYHNRVADQMALKYSGDIAGMAPEEADEFLFQKARRFVVGVYQHILFDEYLPALFGSQFDGLIGEYSGYADDVNPDSNTNMWNSAFRYAHSSVPKEFLIYDENGQNVIAPHVVLDYSDPQAPPVAEFVDVVNRSFIPEFGTQNVPGLSQSGPNPPFTVANHVALHSTQGMGIANVIRSMSRTVTANIDLIYEDSVRDVVAAQSMINAGIDLAAIDIRSAREVGVPDFNRLRGEYLGKTIYQKSSDDDGCRVWHLLYPDDPIECFLEITSDLEVAEELRSRYRKVYNVEGLLGLLAEDKVDGSPLPPTMARMIAREFNLKRSADRFWYELYYADDADTLAEIKSVSMADVFIQTACGLGEPGCALQKSDLGTPDGNGYINAFLVDPAIEQITYEAGACVHAGFYPNLDNPEDASLASTFVACSESYSRDACEVSSFDGDITGDGIPDVTPFQSVFLGAARPYGEQLCPDVLEPQHVNFQFGPQAVMPAVGTCRQGFIHTRDKVYGFPFGAPLNVEEVERWCTSDGKNFLAGGLFGEWVDGAAPSPGPSAYPPPVRN